MSLYINTNIAALNTQRNLGNISSQLATSLQRLSSGLRVNSAKDDAAGMAISQNFTAQIRGNSQAARNANDGISLGQTAEGALGQIASNLQRIREIAVQSANGTLNNTNRGQLQKEVDQLTQEISRIVQTTQFNGTSLLSGASTLTFQVGADGASSNQIQVATTDLTVTAGGGTPAEYAAAQTIANAIASGTDSENAMNQALIAMFATPGMTFSTWGVNSTSASDDFASTTPASAAALAVWNAAKAIYNSGGGLTGGVTVGQLTAAAQPVVNSYAPSTPTLNSYNSNLAGTSTVNVSSQAGASAALALLDSDISQISSIRSTFGAVQNRFEAVTASLQNYVENLTASRSRIMDADYASETATLTRNQILQQAATAVLSQANALPQTALTLLR